MGAEGQWWSALIGDCGWPLGCEVFAAGDSQSIFGTSDIRQVHGGPCNGSGILNPDWFSFRVFRRQHVQEGFEFGDG